MEALERLLVQTFSPGETLKFASEIDECSLVRMRTSWSSWVSNELRSLQCKMQQSANLIAGAANLAASVTSSPRRTNYAMRHLVTELRNFSSHSNTFKTGAQQETM
jgi:hypothetical protein